ncbi:hypothetical protein FO519_005963 [Halicephalobus sp. NKZ332]|nr:hypothetical protein FO519_005963 [Halicephalobus sp. NKZ332]
MEMIRELGRGTFGVVSEMKMDSEVFAVKVIYFENQKGLKMTLKEIKIMKLLNHPLLVSFHTVEVTETKVLIVMDLIRGITLEEVKYSMPEGRLDLEKLKPIFAEMVCSINYLHRIQILHNDIKPKNIGLTFNGHVKLIDFGSAFFIKDEIKEIRGSLGYIAPEVLKREGCSFKSDVWSLGFLFYSIFDIYYQSPLVKGTKPHPITNGAGLAKRVVVFSADGLRSTALFANPELSTFLHGIIREGSGVWGISKSHVPTESRPGHVAMLAGFYEDVSAVTLGWKHNPVKFDSVFNQSRFSYLWGSPDILPMFSHELSQASSWMYTHEEEDFASSDAANLDRWVFEKVLSFFKESENNQELRRKLDEDKQIFFLHLLGLDTNGHGYKPNSEKYLKNIEVVDEGIKNISTFFNNFFKDEKTAFVFTSDHGMTDWGSHGSGTDDEILTPFVAWGSGIQKKISKQVINQVDIAPFISALLGIAVPMNSMVEQYNIRRTEREANSLPYMFKDFPGFKSSVLNKVQEQISELKGQRRLDQAARFCVEWIPRKFEIRPN